MSIRLVVTVLATAFVATAAVAQTRTVPRLQSTPPIQKAPNRTAPGPKHLARSPIRKRVVPDDLHLAMDGIGPGAVRYRRNSDDVWSEPDESRIIVSGAIEMGSQPFWVAKPYIANFRELFPGLPADCQGGGGSYPRTLGNKRGFKLVIRFRDLNDKPQCGAIFRDVESITRSMTHIRVEWTKYGGFKKVAAASPGPVTVHLPPVQPKNQQPPD